jgi:hypothetical protein
VPAVEIIEGGGRAPCVPPAFFGQFWEFIREASILTVEPRSFFAASWYGVWGFVGALKEFKALHVALTVVLG